VSEELTSADVAVASASAVSAPSDALTISRPETRRSPSYCSTMTRTRADCHDRSWADGGPHMYRRQRPWFEVSGHPHAAIDSAVESDVH
jgi:hypothetical protein